MTGNAPVHVPSLGGSIAAVAVGALLAIFGFLAAAASAMASAPIGWRGSIPTALLIVGLTLAALGLASLLVPRLRSAAKWGAVATSIALAGLIAFVQLA